MFQVNKIRLLDYNENEIGFMKFVLESFSANFDVILDLVQPQFQIVLSTPTVKWFSN